MFEIVSNIFNQTEFDLFLKCLGSSLIGFKELIVPLEVVSSDPRPNYLRIFPDLLPL